MRLADITFQNTSGLRSYSAFRFTAAGFAHNAPV
jgi:hypothetical protein